MTTRRLELDHVAARRRAPWLGLGVLAVAIAAAAYLVERYRDSQLELARIEVTQGVVGAERRPASATSKARLEDEYKQVESVVQQLALPWATIIQAVEDAGTSQVAVLQLQPETQQRRLRLTAEAKDQDAIVAYLRRLGETKVLYEVHLVSHQVQLEDPQRPIQFALQASFRMTP
jgi:hypothetical protein